MNLSKLLFSQNLNKITITKCNIMVYAAKQYQDKQINKQTKTKQNKAK